MKKLLFFVCTIFAFVACTQIVIEEQQGVEIEVPETLAVGFEDGDDTRIQLNSAKKTVWNKNDEVSVFYKSYNNLKWQFQGEDGDRSGNLKKVSGNIGSQTMGNVIVVYPYDSTYCVSGDSIGIEATLPAVQNYLDGSYGAGGNIMIAQSEFTQFSLKSVCGWLRIQLTGDGQVVRKITLKGNNEEQIAGLVNINAETAEVTFATEMGDYDDSNNNVGGNLVFDNSIYTEITLDCGVGVALGSTAKQFYIGVLPQTFTNGATAIIECTDGTTKTISTSSKFTLERNHIIPINISEDGESEDNEGENEDIPVDKTQAISFADPNTKLLCTLHWDENEDGELSYEEAAKVTDLGIAFKGSSIMAFTELEHFTALEGIANSAFNGCVSLVKITLPEQITSIGISSFRDCSNLKKITIPDGVTSIGQYAFYNCSSLASSINIPNGVTSIGDYTFYNCSSLTSITIPDSVTSIGKETFYGCTGELIVNCNIPSSVIYNYYSYGAFQDSKFTKVTIGDGVTSIGDYAFYRCSSLTSVTIPDSVTSIGYAAFYRCSSLTGVYYNGDLSDWCNIDFYADASSNPLCYGAKLYINNAEVAEITIPSDISKIKDYTFNGCSSLTSITIPDSVTSIGSYAFNGCSSLTSITIGNSVTSIGDYAFCYCSSLIEFNGKFAEDNGRILVVDGTLISFAPAELTEYIIPDSVTSIRSLAFGGCNSLTSITIPNSVTSIGDLAFYNCSSLVSVYCKPITPPEGGWGAFMYSDDEVYLYFLGCKIYVPTASVDAYKSTSDWIYIADYIVGYDFENGIVVE